MPNNAYNKWIQEVVHESISRNKSPGLKPCSNAKSELIDHRLGESESNVSKDLPISKIE